MYANAVDGAPGIPSTCVCHACLTTIPLKRYVQQTMHHYPGCRSIQTHSACETQDLGRRMGEAASAGDLVCLSGDLGAGKTTLVQGIAGGLNLPPNRVSSPTYTILAEYPDARIPLYHLDVYRLEGASQLYDIGIDDYLRRGDGLIVVEWAERVAAQLPADRLDIAIGFSSAVQERLFEFVARGPAAARLLARLSLDPCRAEHGAGVGRETQVE